MRLFSFLRSGNSQYEWKNKYVFRPTSWRSNYIQNQKAGEYGMLTCHTDNIVNIHQGKIIRNPLILCVTLSTAATQMYLITETIKHGSHTVILITITNIIQREYLTLNQPCQWDINLQVKTFPTLFIKGWPTSNSCPGLLFPKLCWPWKLACYTVTRV